MGMTVNPTDGMNILRQAHDDPSVKAAQASLDHWKAALDQVELSLSLPRDQCFQANEAAYQSAWAVHNQNVARMFAYPFLGCLVGAAVATSRIAAAVPALQPFSGLLVIASLVATWKLVPRGIRRVEHDLILPRLCYRDLKRDLARQETVDRHEVEYARRKLDRTLQEVTQTLYQQAAAREAAQPEEAGKVTVDDTTVTIGSVKLAKRLPSSAGAPSTPPQNISGMNGSGPAKAAPAPATARSLPSSRPAMRSSAGERSPE